MRQWSNPNMGCEGDLNPLVLIITYAFPPAASAAVFRIGRLLRYLPEFGWRPMVVTPRVENVRPITLDRTLERLVPQGTIVERTSVLRPFIAAQEALGRLTRFTTATASNSAQSGMAEASAAGSAGKCDCDQRPSSLRTTLRGLSRWLETPDRHVGWVAPGTVAALRLIRRHRPQVIVSSGPPHSAHLIAVLLKSLTGIPVVLDFRDPWTRLHWQHDGMLGARGAFYRRLERWCIAAADRVVLNTGPLFDEFCAYYGGASAARFAVITNGYDPEMLKEVREVCNGHARVRTGSQIRLCHAGSVYGQRNLLPVVSAVAKLVAAGHDVHMEQLGDVDRQAEIGQYIRQHNLESHVTLSRSVPHTEALKHLATADVLVILQPDTSIQIPAKLFEVMLFRKPILAVADAGPTADIIRRYGLGETASPAKPDEIATAILAAAQQVNVAERNVGWDAALGAFDGCRLTSQFADVLDAAVSRS